MTEIRMAYPIDIVNKIASYLATRPFGEVHVLIHDLQTKGIKVDNTLEVSKPLSPEMEMLASR